MKKALRALKTAGELTIALFVYYLESAKSLLGLKHRTVLYVQDLDHIAYNSDCLDKVANKYMSQSLSAGSLARLHTILPKLIGKTSAKSKAVFWSKKQILSFNNTSALDRLAFVEIENHYCIGHHSKSYKARDFNSWKVSMLDIENKLNGHNNTTFIAFSCFLKDMCRAYPGIYGNNANKVSVIYPSVSPEITESNILDRYSMPKKRLKVLGFSTKFWGKGSPLFLEVARICKDIEFTLLLSDDHEDSWRLENIPTYPNCEVVYIKERPMSNSRKYEYFSDNDVFLHPLLQDAIGVYLDCMAFGLPVLSTDIYDKSEFVEHGKTGYLCKTPYDMWSQIAIGKLSSYNQFIRIVKKLYSEGMFDSLIQQLALALMRLDANREVLLEMSISNLSRCMTGVNSHGHKASQIEALIKDLIEN